MRPKSMNEKLLLKSKVPYAWFTLHDISHDSETANTSVSSPVFTSTQCDLHFCDEESDDLQPSCPHYMMFYPGKNLSKVGQQSIAKIKFDDACC